MRVWFPPRDLYMSQHDPNMDQMFLAVHDSFFMAANVGLGQTDVSQNWEHHKTTGFCMSNSKCFILFDGLAVPHDLVVFKPH